MTIENVGRVFRLIEEAVTERIEVEHIQALEKAGALHQGNETHLEFYDRFSAADLPSPESISVESPDFPDGFVYKRSVEVIWQYLSRGSEFWVSQSGRKPEKVVVTDFAEPSNSISVENRYFNVLTGKTIQSGFLTDKGRSADAGEDVFIEPRGLSDLIAAIAQDDAEGIVKAEAASDTAPTDHQLRKGSGGEKDLTRLIIDHFDSGKLKRPYRQNAMKLCPELFSEGRKNSNAFNRAYTAAGHQREELSKAGRPKGS